MQADSQITRLTKKVVGSPHTVSRAAFGRAFDAADRSRAHSTSRRALVLAQADPEFLKCAGDVVRIERLGQYLQTRVLCEARADFVPGIPGGQNHREIRTQSSDRRDQLVAGTVRQAEIDDSGRKMRAAFLKLGESLLETGGSLRRQTVLGEPVHEKGL